MLEFLSALVKIMGYLIIIAVVSVFVGNLIEAGMQDGDEEE